MADSKFALQSEPFYGPSSYLRPCQVAKVLPHAFMPREARQSRGIFGMNGRRPAASGKCFHGKDASLPSRCTATWFISSPPSPAPSFQLSGPPSPFVLPSSRQPPFPPLLFSFLDPEVELFSRASRCPSRDDARAARARAQPACGLCEGPRLARRLAVALPEHHSHDGPLSVSSRSTRSNPRPAPRRPSPQSGNCHRRNASTSLICGYDKDGRTPPPSAPGYAKQPAPPSFVRSREHLGWLVRRSAAAPGPIRSLRIPFLL